MFGETLRELIKKDVEKNGPKEMVKFYFKQNKFQQYNIIFVGHLHVETTIRERGKTFHFQPAYFDKLQPTIVKFGIFKYYVISDLHIGSDWWTRKQTKALNKLLDEIEKMKNVKLLLLGDVFELWTQDPHKVINKYKNIVNRFRKLQQLKKLIYVKGNHDWDINEYVKDLNTVEYYSLNKILFIHGHQIDPVMNASFLRKAWLWFWLNYGDELWRINNWLRFWKK